MASRSTSRTLDDGVWAVATDDALAPPSSYMYDRKAGKIDKLFDTRPALSEVAAGADRSRRAQGARRPDARVLSIAAAGLRRRTATACRMRRCRWCSRCTVARGRAMIYGFGNAPVAREPRLRSAQR